MSPFYKASLLNKTTLQLKINDFIDVSTADDDEDPDV